MAVLTQVNMPNPPHSDWGEYCARPGTLALQTFRATETGAQDVPIHRNPGPGSDFERSHTLCHPVRARAKSSRAGRGIQSTQRHSKMVSILSDVFGTAQRGMTKQKNGDRLVKLSEREELISLQPPIRGILRRVPRDDRVKAFTRLYLSMRRHKEGNS